MNKDTIQIIATFIMGIWIILAILSANKKYLKLILESFEFWFKMLYMIHMTTIVGGIQYDEENAMI